MELFSVSQGQGKSKKMIWQTHHPLMLPVTEKVREKNQEEIQYITLFYTKIHITSTTLSHYFGIQGISIHPISSLIQNRTATTSSPSVAGDGCAQEHFCPLLFNSLTFNMF